MPTYPVKAGITKDPSAVLDYPFVFERWLQGGEDLNSQVVSITPSGELTLVSSAIESDIMESTTLPDGTKQVTNVGQGVVVWLSGGVAGKTYTVACRVTTDAAPQARTDERSVKIRCEER